jgi:hypothetical protein
MAQGLSAKLVTSSSSEKSRRSYPSGGGQSGPCSPPYADPHRSQWGTGVSVSAIVVDLLPQGAYNALSPARAELKMRVEECGGWEVDYARGWLRRTDNYSGPRNLDRQLSYSGGSWRWSR